jgi:hypothetical protein
MNYAMRTLEIRQRRDAQIELARIEAKAALAAAVSARDAEIRRLRAERPDIGCGAIAAMIGCCRSTVHELVRPEKHVVYNRRRIEHWHARAAESAAA